MKTVRLLVAALLISTAVTAQNYGNGSSPQVLIVGSTASAEPEMYAYNSPEEVKAHIRAKKRDERRVKFNATEKLKEVSHTDEFQGDADPLLIVAQKENKFAFAVGGYVNLRASYDFNGVVQNTDFVTSLIPIPGNYATRQQMMLDASTSRVYFQGVANTRALVRLSYM